MSVAYHNRYIKQEHDDGTDYRLLVRGFLLAPAGVPDASDAFGCTIIRPSCISCCVALLAVARVSFASRKNIKSLSWSRSSDISCITNEKYQHGCTIAYTPVPLSHDMARLIPQFTLIEANIRFCK